MLKRNTNTVVIITTIIVAAVLTLSLGLKLGLKKTVFYFSDDSYSPRYIKYYEADYEWTKSAKKWNEEDTKVIRDLYSDVCNFLNTEYQANLPGGLKFNVYSSSVTDEIAKQTSDFSCGALCYNGNIYVDENFVKEELDDQTTYILVHEIIHLLRNPYSYNVFSLKLKSEVCGEYLEEAVIDSLARRYMLSKNPALDVTILNSAYKYIRLCVDLLQIDVPDLFKYFFENDIEGLQKKVDKLAQKYLICNGSAFEKYSSMIDEMQLYKETLIEDRMSAVMSFIAVITPKEQYEAFAERAAENNIDASMYKDVMH